MFAGRGVSYCATCDGPFFKGEDIVVVGGGDTALEEATFLSKFGKSIKIVHRRDSLRASKILQDKAFENPKIEFLWNSVVSDIIGDKKIASIVVRDVYNGKEQKIHAGGLFVAIGHDPNTGIFTGQLELDDKGYIALKNNSLTSVEGVFADWRCPRLPIQTGNYCWRVWLYGRLGCGKMVDGEKTQRK